MATIDGLKEQIKVMSDLKDITNMLEQVAARDIARMRYKIVGSRTYFDEIWKIHAILKKVVPPPSNLTHKHLVIIVCLDWGMPGGLLNKIIAKGEKMYQELEGDLLVAGKMGHKRFAGRDERTIHMFNIPKEANMSDIEPIYKVVASYAHIHIVYPRFDSLSSQVVAVSELSTDENIENNENDIKAARFLVEPNPQSVSDYINETIIGATMYHYFAEAQLAYSAAQMIAMRNAYDNAKDESNALGQQFYRAKREIIDSKLRELYVSSVANK